MQVPQYFGDRTRQSLVREKNCLISYSCLRFFNFCSNNRYIFRRFSYQFTNLRTFITALLCSLVQKTASQFTHNEEMEYSQKISCSQQLLIIKRFYAGEYEKLISTLK